MSAYRCGPLSARSFFPALSFSSTEHNPFLQLADLVLGSCGDFIKWACDGRKGQRVIRHFPIVHKRLRSATYHSEFRTGFVAHPWDFRRLLERKYEELHKVQRTATSEAPLGT